MGCFVRQPTHCNVAGRSIRRASTSWPLGVLLSQFLPELLLLPWPPLLPLLLLLLLLLLLCITATS